MTIIILEAECFVYDDELIPEKCVQSTVEVDEPEGSSFMDNGGLDGFPRLSKEAENSVKRASEELVQTYSNGIEDDVLVSVFSIDGEIAYWPGL